MTSLPPTKTRFIAFGALLLAVAVSTPLHAQRDGIRDEATLRGLVVDEMSGSPVPAAVVRLGENGRAILTNADGRFSVREIEQGSHTLVVTQLGYDTLRAEVTFDGPGEPVTLRLTPDPVVLERVTAMADQFAADRNRLGTSVRVFDRRRLLVSASYTALEFLQSRTSLLLTRCPSRLSMDACAFVRGRPMEVQVFVDGARVVGGLAMLDAYRPDELYSLEVIGGGRAVRAYTNWYVEAVAEGRRNPPTFFFW